MSQCTYSGAVKSPHRLKKEADNPDRTDRSFRPGQIVRFLPPEGATTLPEGAGIQWWTV